MPRKPLTSLFALIAGFAATFALAQPTPGECPQPRFTGKAPPDYYERTNSVTASPQNIKSGEQLFLGNANSESCSLCHGRKGDGKGALAKQYDPPPRNFACAKTVSGVPDGQLFWIIRFGSPGTAMPPHEKFSEEQVWQLVLHLRQLAK